MASKEDPTHLFLHKIHKEIQATNVLIDKGFSETNSRIDETNSRIDETNSRIKTLEGKVTESEIRLATEVIAVQGTLARVSDLLGDGQRRFDDHEGRITTLETRTG